MLYKYIVADWRLIFVVSILVLCAFVIQYGIYEMTKPQTVAFEGTCTLQPFESGQEDVIMLCAGEEVNIGWFSELYGSTVRSLIDSKQLKCIKKVNDENPSDIDWTCG